MRRALISVLVALGAFVAPGVASAMDVNVLAQRSEAWLNANLPNPVLHRPVQMGDPALMRNCGRSHQPTGQLAVGCVGIAYHDRILLAPSVWNQIEAYRPNSRARYSVVPVDAFDVLLHEQLHQDRVPGGVEEGIVDSLMSDLAPAWSAAMFKADGPFPTADIAYDPQVAAIRKASARMAHAGWRTRAARGMRVALWSASGPDRDAALAAVSVVVPPIEATVPGRPATGRYGFPLQQSVIVRLYPHLLNRRPVVWAAVRRRAFSRWVDTHPAAVARQAAAEARIRADAVWVALAECESHNTWDINTGNGFYGGLQFDREFGETYGSAAARAKGTANHWTRREQIDAAERARATRGYTPWPTCGRRLGLIR